MLEDLRSTALRWQEEGLPAVVVVVLSHRGSVPRETGTRMLVAADEVVGTIGGGHLEWKAISDARALLGCSPAPSPRPQEALTFALAPSPFKGEGRGEGKGASEPDSTFGGHSSSTTQPSPSTEESQGEGRPAPVVQRIALGPGLGQCCGGALELSFTLLAHVDVSCWPTAPPLFTLQLYGAGHVGRAIVQLLRGIHCQVQWIDEREAEFPPAALPAHIQRVCGEPVQAEVVTAPAGAFYLVLTHSHDLDLAITQAVLARGDFGFFGLIGSKTKRARFEHRLLHRGFAPSSIERMTCPIGVPGIAGKEPEVIAVAVVAQLLQAASQ